MLHNYLNFMKNIIKQSFYISENGEVTAALCTGDWTQHLEPIDEVLPPEFTTTEN